MSIPKVKIGDLVQIRAGYQTRGAVKARAGGSHVLLQIRDFDEARSRIDVEGMVRVSPGRINEAQVLHDGDVVFLAKGAKNFAFVPREIPRPALVASYFFLVRPSDEIDADYLAWFLNLDTTRAALARLVAPGSHMPVVRREYLEGLEVSLPSLERQRTIAAVDALAARRQHLLDELAETQRTLATALCVRAAGTSTKKQAMRERPMKEQTD